jgi:hypothetical protein
LNHMGSNSSDDPRLKRRHPLSAVIWNLSNTIALFAIGIVFLAVLFTTFAGQFRLFDTFSAGIPQPIHDFFNQRIEMDPAQLPEGVKEGVRRAGPRPAQPRDTAARFTVGASEAEILRIQGRPNRVVGSTWYYGDSEIQFFAGHVISWKNSSKNPLRIR